MTEQAKVTMQHESMQHEHGTEQGHARASGARRPYRAPKLTYLGSVRELTLGATAGKRFDFGRPRRK